MDREVFALVWIATLITLLEIVAIIYGIDGQMYATSISAIVGLFGFVFGSKIQKLHSNFDK